MAFNQKVEQVKKVLSQAGKYENVSPGAMAVSSKAPGSSTKVFVPQLIDLISPARCALPPVRNVRFPPSGAFVFESPENVMVFTPSVETTVPVCSRELIVVPLAKLPEGAQRDEPKSVLQAGPQISPPMSSSGLAMPRISTRKLNSSIVTGPKAPVARIMVPCVRFAQLHISNWIFA